MAKLPTMFVDFNATTDDGAIRLTTEFVANQVGQLGIRPGDRVRLHDGNLSVPASIEYRPPWGLVAVPDWPTWGEDSSGST